MSEIPQQEPEQHGQAQSNKKLPEFLRKHFNEWKASRAERLAERQRRAEILAEFKRMQEQGTYNLHPIEPEKRPEPLKEQHQNTKPQPPTEAEKRKAMAEIRYMLEDNTEIRYVLGELVEENPQHKRLTGEALQQRLKQVRAEFGLADDYPKPEDMAQEEQRLQEAYDRNGGYTKEEYYKAWLIEVAKAQAAEKAHEAEKEQWLENFRKEKAQEHEKYRREIVEGLPFEDDSIEHLVTVPEQPNSEDLPGVQERLAAYRENPEIATPEPPNSEELPGVPERMQEYKNLVNPPDAKTEPAIQERLQQLQQREQATQAPSENISPPPETPPAPEPPAPPQPSGS